MADSGAISKDLIGTLSHQLKSPVTTIQSLLKTISDGFTGETNVQTLQFIDKALKKAAEANALIADLLRFNASTTGKSMAKDDVELSGIAESVVSSYGAEASEKNISLRMRIPQTTAIVVRGDGRGIVRQHHQPAVAHLDGPDVAMGGTTPLLRQKPPEDRGCAG